MGYKAAVQILKQAEDLKNKVVKKSDLLVDSQAWTDQQKLQTIYHQVLVLDLEYALDKKVEQDLWNIGFKQHITALQELTRDKKNSRRAECQALLTWCLEAASGFYLTLLQELCNAFDIDLPFRRRGTVYGQATLAPELNLPQSSSCIYICQYCLVHLGDIARYRNQRKQAENFYKEAILVSPTSGHPYNQLALLEASQGNKLSTVFYYIRGIAVKNPFPASTTNLLNTLNSAIDKESPLEKVQTKLNAIEFIQIFLSSHAFLHTATELTQAGICVKTLNTTMTALVATQSFSSEKLIKITAINLYALKHISASSSNEELTADEKIVREYVLDLLAGSLSAFLVPVHTLKNDESLLDYYALPAVKILMFWIRNEPDVLKETVFINRLQIWPSLCKLLNSVAPFLEHFEYSQYANTPLPEDRTLQGFRPLLKSFKDLDFKREPLDDKKIENMIRMKRIIGFGLFVTELDINNSKLIIKKGEGEKFTFEPGCIQPDPTKELLEEMKSFNVSDSLSLSKKGVEKRAGILKPQGSLEKSREERELLSSEPNLMSDLSNASSSSSLVGNGKRELTKIKRSKQNVALQSIFKKLEETNKQVKFNVEETEKDKDKIGSFDANLSKTVSPPSTSQFNLPLRTQSFNQNHPAFPLPPNQPDYLSSLRNMSVKQNNFPPYSKTEPPPTNIKSMPPQHLMPYPNMPNSQSLFGNNPNTNNFPMPPNSFNPPINRNVPPYQNVQFPPPNVPYNMKVEEPTRTPNSPWWPAPNAPQQAFQRPENFPMNFPYNNNMPPYMQNDYGKPQNNQAGGDMFNYHWNTFGNRPNFHNEGGNMNFDNNRGMSMRQAMLKEASGASGRPVNPNVQNPQPAPGYSLFNANSWTPNLMGQLRNKTPDNSISHMPQHSLFTGQGPQSLAQLLEQQQSQKNDS